MLSDNLKSVIRKRSITVLIIWGAMLVTIGQFCLVLFMITSNPKQNVAAVDNNLKMIFYVIAATLAVGSFMLRKFLLSETMAAKHLSKPVKENELIPNQAQLPDAEKEKLKNLTPSEKRLLALCQPYFTATILSLAINEVVALVGFLLAVISHDFKIFIPFAVLAFLLDLIIMPRLESYIDEISSGIRQ